MQRRLTQHVGTRLSLAALILFTSLPGCTESEPPRATSTARTTKPMVQRPTASESTSRKAPPTKAQSKPKTKPGPKIKLQQKQKAPSKPKPKPVSPAELARRRWLKVVPTLREADKRRAATFIANQDRLDQSVRSLVTEQGIQTFIDHALGMQSKAIALQDKSKHQEWLRNLFVEHIFPLAQLKQLMEDESHLLERQLAEIDNQTLVAIRADVDLDPKAVRVREINVAGIQNHLDAVLDEVRQSVDQSLVKSISSFLFGAAGFEAARQGTRHAMRDDHGNVSLLGEIISFGVGFVAEEVTRTVADEVLQTRATIEADLRGAARDLLEECTAGSRIAGERATAVNRHQQALLAAVTQSIGVEPNWAAKNYQ